jgi:hypothetical protein
MGITENWGSVEWSLLWIACGSVFFLCISLLVIIHQRNKSKKPSQREEQLMKTISDMIEIGKKGALL